MGSIFSKNTIDDNWQNSDQYPFDPNLAPVIKNLLPKLNNFDKKKVYADFLARKIKRNPRDLLSHTQRIYLNFILADEEAYFGALVDLFITLGPKGLQLKKSVLGPTYSLLEKKHKIFIKRHLRSGILASQEVPTRESRLAKGTSSATSIVTLGKTIDQQDKPLKIAREKLAHNDFHTARLLLENALEDDPSDMEVAYELLEIYRNQNLRSHFTTMSTRLAGKSIAAHDKWSETEDYFSQNRSQ